MFGAVRINGDEHRVSSQNARPGAVAPSIIGARGFQDTSHLSPSGMVAGTPLLGPLLTGEPTAVASASFDNSDPNGEDLDGIGASTQHTVPLQSAANNVTASSQPNGPRLPRTRIHVQADEDLDVVGTGSDAEGRPITVLGATASLLSPPVAVRQRSRSTPAPPAPEDPYRPPIGVLASRSRPYDANSPFGPNHRSTGGTGAPSTNRAVTTTLAAVRDPPSTTHAPRLRSRTFAGNGDGSSAYSSDEASQPVQVYTPHTPRGANSSPLGSSSFFPADVRQPAAGPDQVRTAAIAATLRQLSRNETSQSPSSTATTQQPQSESDVNEATAVHRTAQWVGTGRSASETSSQPNRGLGISTASGRFQSQEQEGAGQSAVDRASRSAAIAAILAAGPRRTSPSLASRDSSDEAGSNPQPVLTSRFSDDSSVRSAESGALDDVPQPVLTSHFSDDSSIRGAESGGDDSIEADTGAAVDASPPSPHSPGNNDDGESVTHHIARPAPHSLTHRPRRYARRPSTAPVFAGLTAFGTGARDQPTDIQDPSGSGQPPTGTLSLRSHSDTLNHESTASGLKRFRQGNSAWTALAPTRGSRLTPRRPHTASASMHRRSGSHSGLSRQASISGAVRVALMAQATEGSPHDEDIEAVSAASGSRASSGSGPSEGRSANVSSYDADEERSPCPPEQPMGSESSPESLASGAMEPSRASSDLEPRAEAPPP